MSYAAMRIAILVPIVLSLGLLSACASAVPAHVTLLPEAPLGTSAAIYLIALKQPERVATSLTAAGFQITDDYFSDAYSLTVNVGNSRSVQGCGSVNNVEYVLSRGEQLVVIKGRGRTGSCEPNIFDDMSRKLASFRGSS